MKDKKRYWQEPGWDPLSPRRKYPWSVSNPGDWQHILSTYDCLLTDPQDEHSAPKPDSHQPE